MRVPIESLQPSQLYINIEKYRTVSLWLTPATCADISLPVIQIEERLIVADGHTRLLRCFQLGARQIEVHIDTDPLDVGLYSECVSWCRAEGITSIDALASRMLEKNDFCQKWIARCQKAASMRLDENATKF